jgi:hypothetical protein
MRRNGLLFFNLAWCREAFHGLVIQDVSEFDSDRCPLFCLLGEEKRTEKEKWLGVFIPLLAVLHWISVAVRCN